MGTKVERLWPNSTTVCIASGPSLVAADCDYVRGKARVIAVNDGIRLAPFADALYSSDRNWWPHHHAVPSFSGLRFGIGSSVGKKNPFAGYPEIQVLRNSGFDGLDLDPGGLRNGHNSGFAAVNLAVHLGAARILLLGYDMGTRNGLTHFFGQHVGMANPTDTLFANFRRLFATMVEPLRELGIEVINCTPGSSLSCFPMADLREALPVTAEVAA